MSNSRVIACRILMDVLRNGRSLDNAFIYHLKQLQNTRDKAFVKALCFGVLRWYHQLDFFSRQLLNKPLKSKDIDIHMALLIGMYQLLHMDVPTYAAISETVNIAKALKKTWGAGLLNKCLRRFDQEKETLLKQCGNNPSHQYSHPDWLVHRIETAYPNQATAIFQANNQQAPMFLRVNRQKISRDDYLSLLKERGISAKAIKDSTTAILIQSPCDVTELPHFDNGFCSIQDLAGQRVVEYLDLHPGQRILDACAAPGSKTCHILESCNEPIKLIAIDKDPERLQKINDNVTRLELSRENVQVLSADLNEPKQWWDKKYFDRILLDAPCSATGVIRRHPDIKVLRRNSDIDQLVKQQQCLLDTAWQLLAPSGLLLYTTCSILPEENQQQINSFLQRHTNAAIAGINQQQLPEQTDGFYYCRLKKA